MDNKLKKNIIYNALYQALVILLPILTMPYLVKLLAGYTDELLEFMDLSKLLTTCFDISSVVIMGLPAEFVFGELSEREVVKLAFENIPSAVWMYYMANFDDRVTKMMGEMRNGTAEHA